MSSVSLKSIKINWSTGSDLFRLAGVINSHSGLYTPKVIRSNQELSTYYGDFNYNEQYKAFIDLGIPVIMLNLHGPYQKYNKSSIRFEQIENNIARTSTPKYQSEDFIETYLKDMMNIPSSINRDAQTFSTILEIPSDILDKNYFIIDFGKTTGSLAYKVYYYYQTQIVSTSNYSKSVEITNTSIDSIITLIENSIPDNIQQYIQIDIYKLIDIMNIIYNSAKDQVISELYEQRCIWCLKESVIERIERGELTLDYIFQNRSRYTSYFDWSRLGVTDELCDILCKAHYYLLDSSEVSSAIINRIKTDGVTSGTIVSDAYKDLMEKVLGDRDAEYNKILITNLNSANSSMDYKGFKLSDCDEFNSDIINISSSQSKVLDIYALPYGPVGNDVNIEINTTDDDGIYNINISNDHLFESFNFYIVRPRSDIDALSIEELNRESKLVQFIAYTYEKDGKLVSINEIDPEDYDWNNDKTAYTYEYDPTEGADNSHYIDNVLDRFRLPIGEFKLSGAKEYNNTLVQARNTIRQFSELKFYPDLVLVDNIPDDMDYFNYSKFLEYLQDLVSAGYDEILENPDQVPDEEKPIRHNFSQLLINIKNKDIVKSDGTLRTFTEPKSNVIYGNSANDNTNRLIFTYNDCLIDEIRYSLNYIYVLDILNSTYLNNQYQGLYYHPFEIKLNNNFIVLNESSYKVKSIYLFDDNFIYFDESDYLSRLELIEQSDNIRDYLKSQQVNMLDYNNLGYYYMNLQEPFNQHSIFAIRYLTSKLSRELLKVRHNLCGLNKPQIISVLDSVVNKVRSSSDLYQSIIYDSDFNSDKLDLRFIITIKGLTNKKYYLSYILNIN